MFTLFFFRTAATLTASFRIRATYALLPFFLGLADISQRTSDNANKNSYNNQVFHRLYLLKATSAFAFFSDLSIRFAIIPIITVTATRPGTNPFPTVFSVIIVPI